MIASTSGFAEQLTGYNVTIYLARGNKTAGQLLKSEVVSSI